MLKQPLFGQDSSPHITSMLLSAIFTLVAWIIFCVMCLVIKFKPQVPEYKEVQIVLSSTPIADPEPVEGLVEEAAAAAEESVAPEPVEAPELPKPVETPVAEARVEAPKKDAAPAKLQTQKTTAAKKETQTTKATDPSKKVNFDDFQYATDYSDFDFNNTAPTTKKTTWDDSMFDDAPSEPEVKVSQKVDKVTTSSTIQGSAASTTTQKTQSQTSSQNKTQTTTPAASSSTSSMLSNIKNTQYSTSTGSNTKTITEAKTTKGSDGTLSMEMTDGSTRVLINPVPPIIKLSEAAAALIDTTRTVTIEFQVLSSGNVPRAQVKITPESQLPQEVRNEIYDQLSSWVFEASSSSARATFEYTIQKR